MALTRSRISAACSAVAVRLRHERGGRGVLQQSTDADRVELGVHQPLDQRRRRTIVPVGLISSSSSGTAGGKARPGSGRPEIPGVAVGVLGTCWWPGAPSKRANCAATSAPASADTGNSARARGCRTWRTSGGSSPPAPSGRRRQRPASSTRPGRPRDCLGSHVADQYGLDHPAAVEILARRVTVYGQLPPW